MSALHRLRGRTKASVGLAMVGTGLAAGAILGSTLTAGASTNPAATLSSSSGSSSTSATNGTSGSAGAGNTGASNSAPAYRGLPDSGTVGAVGSNSVTINGTNYAVTSSSDIDKNGEASLSSLAVGDTVTFSTVSSASTPTIDKLHAGSESLDRPTGPPPGGAGAPSSSTGSSTSVG